MKFRNYYLSLIGLFLGGVAALSKTFSPNIAGTVIEVLGTIFLCGWVSKEVIDIHRNRTEKNTLLTTIDLGINAVCTTSQILRLIPQMQPDKEGKFNDAQKISLACISVVYTSMWLTGLAYINTQSREKLPQVRVVDPEDPAARVDEMETMEPTISPNNSSSNLIK